MVMGPANSTISQVDIYIDSISSSKNGEFIKISDDIYRHFYIRKNSSIYVRLQKLYKISPFVTVQYCNTDHKPIISSIETLKLRKAVVEVTGIHPYNINPQFQKIITRNQIINGNSNCVLLCKEGSMPSLGKYRIKYKFYGYLQYTITSIQSISAA